MTTQDLGSTITFNGTNVNMTKAQLQGLTNRIAKAKANAAELAQVQLQPRTDFTMGDMLGHAGAQAADIKARAIGVAEDFLQLGREIVQMRSIYPSDKVWGAFIKGSQFERELSASDRSDLMYLGRNYPIARKALSKAIGDGVTQVGISAIRKRTKAMADSEGVKATIRDTSAKQSKTPAEATLGPSETGGNVSNASEKPSKHNGADKVARKVAVTADTIASDALEQAVRAGISPQDLLTAMTKAIMESLAA